QRHRRVTQNLIARNNMKIHPAPPNRKPYFVRDTLSRHDADTGRAYVSVIANSCIDPDMDPLTYSKTGGPKWLTVKPNGIVTGTPGPSDKGPGKFTVMVKDGKGGSDKATLNIAVDPARGQR
ncbi:MAG: putative Ig domain-containing protein, partial [Planctomycetes bacterium]|nr:putative Ig domain-containing protein [Planctomycetota bacterium]